MDVRWRKREHFMSWSYINSIQGRSIMFIIWTIILNTGKPVNRQRLGDGRPRHDAYNYNMVTWITNLNITANASYRIELFLLAQSIWYVCAGFFYISFPIPMLPSGIHKRLCAGGRISKTCATCLQYTRRNGSQWLRSHDSEAMIFLLSYTTLLSLYLQV